MGTHEWMLVAAVRREREVMREAPPAYAETPTSSKARAVARKTVPHSLISLHTLYPPSTSIEDSPAGLDRAAEKSNVQPLNGVLPNAFIVASSAIEWSFSSPAMTDSVSTMI